MMRQVTYTALIQKRPKGYIGWVEEVPGANTQGKSQKEVMENLMEALAMVLDANKVTRNRRGLHRRSFQMSIPA